MLTDKLYGVRVFHPDKDCTKAGRPVIDVLCKKHPEMMVPDLTYEGMAAFKDYDKLLETVPIIDCDAEIVDEVAS